MYRVFRIIRAISHSFGLGVFFLYVALFLGTFSLIFIFPPGALVMVFLGLAGLLAAAIVGWSLRTMEHLFARSLLKQGVCPGCANRHLPDRLDDTDWQCEQCGAVFMNSGAEKGIGLQT